MPLQKLYQGQVWIYFRFIHVYPPRFPLYLPLSIPYYTTAFIFRLLYLFTLGIPYSGIYKQIIPLRLSLGTTPLYPKEILSTTEPLPHLFRSTISLLMSTVPWTWFFSRFQHSADLDDPALQPGGHVYCQAVQGITPFCPLSETFPSHRWTVQLHRRGLEEKLLKRTNFCMLVFVFFSSTPDGIPYLDENNYQPLIALHVRTSNHINPDDTVSKALDNLNRYFLDGKAQSHRKE